MTNINAHIRALPLLAQVMGKQLGVKVSLQGRTAYTDGERIVLPALPLDSPNIEALLSGYLDHEAGHVRASDFGVLKRFGGKPFERNILNILEDVRVEKLLGEIYPGCRINLARLVKILVNEGGHFAEVDSSNAGHMVSGYLLYSLRSKILGQIGLDELAADAACKIEAQYPGLRAELDAVVRRPTGSTPDCVALTEEVVAVMKKYVENPPPPPPSPESNPEKDEEQGNQDQEQQDQGGSGDSPDTDETGNDSEEDGQTSGSENESEAEAEDTGSGSEKEQDTETSESPASQPQSGAESAGTGASDMPTPQPLLEALNAEEKDLVKNLGDVVRDIIEAEAEEAWRDSGAFACADAACVQPLYALDENRVRKETNALRARLVGLLQAQRQVRNFPRRTGHKVDSKRLVRASFGCDQRIFRGQSLRQGLNTAIHVLVDRSGSMEGYSMQIANETMLAIKLALEGQQGISLGISAFPADHTGGYQPLLRHGTTAFRDTRFGLSAKGGTPLAEALLGVAGQMVCLQEERKIVVVVTDGNPNNTSQAKAVVDLLSRSGFEIVGIGIELPSVQSFIKDSIVIEDVNELPTKLFSQLQRLLVA